MALFFNRNDVKPSLIGQQQHIGLFQMQIVKISNIHKVSRCYVKYNGHAEFRYQWAARAFLIKARGVHRSNQSTNYM